MDQMPNGQPMRASDRMISALGWSAIFLTLLANSASAQGGFERCEAKIAAIRRDVFSNYKDQGSMLIFRSRVSNTLKPVVFDYVSALGGTYVEGGDGEFLVEIDRDGKAACPGRENIGREDYLMMTVKIYSLQTLDGSRNLILIGEAAKCFPSSNYEASEKSIAYEAFCNIRF